MSKEMRKHIDTFKGRMLKENVEVNQQKSIQHIINNEIVDRFDTGNVSITTAIEAVKIAYQEIIDMIELNFETTGELGGGITEVQSIINRIEEFKKRTEDTKFPLTDDGRMGLNLEFKYKSRVYYIDTNNRTVKTEQYPDIEIKLPKRIVLPNINTIEDKFSGDFNRRISNLEQSLEVDNVHYKDLQDYLKSINWEMEKDKQNLKSQLEDFINDYDEDVLHNVINQLNIQFNKR